MKMKKIIVVAMAIGCCLTNAFGAMAEANGKTWFFGTIDSTAIILGCSDGIKDPAGDLNDKANWKTLTGEVKIPARLVCEAGAFTVTGIDRLIYAPDPGAMSVVTVHIPASVTSLADDAFVDCTDLKYVFFEGDICDSIDIATVFKDTPYLERQIGFWSRNGRNTTIANAYAIEPSAKSSTRYQYVEDSNLYKPEGVSDTSYTVAPKWYKVTPAKSGYLTLNTWSTDKKEQSTGLWIPDLCDLTIDISRGFDLDVEDVPEEISSWTFRGEKPDGFAHADVEKGKTYFIRVTGYKNKGRRACGHYQLTPHFGTKKSYVSLRLNGGTVPATVAGFYAPVGDSLGELPTPTRDGYAFSGWFEDAKCTDKYGPYTEVGTKTKVLYAGWKAGVHYLSVVNDPSRGSKVTAKAPNASNKTVTYQDASGFYGKAALYNGSVTLTATPRDGYVFDRWQLSDNDGETSSGFLDDAAGAALINKFVASLRNPTLTFNMPARNLIAAAQYIPSWKDYARPVLGQPTEWYLEDGVRECTFKFACGTYPKVSYSATKGLIGDMAFSWNYDGTNVTCMLIANDRAMKKPGIWTLSVTVNGQSGAKAGHVLKIIGANDKTATTASQSGPARLMGLNTDCRHTPYTNLVVGVKCNEQDWAYYGLHADTENGWSIAGVSGVPGVSFDPKLNRGYGGLTGAPTKAGTFVATVTVEKVTKKKVGKKIKVTTESKDATCLVVVQPLPEWLVGSYSGWTSELLPGYVGEDAAAGFVPGSRIVKATISSTGKFSADVGGTKFAVNNLKQAVMWEGTSNEPKRRVVYGYDVDVVKQSKDTAGKYKGKVTSQDDLHLEFGCEWTNFYDRASTGTCTRWRKANNSTQVSAVSLHRNEFGKTLTAMDPTVFDMLLQIYYDDRGEVRVSDLTREHYEEDELYAFSHAEKPDYVVSTGYLDGRKALYNALWTDGAGTAYFSGFVHYDGKSIDMTGTGAMCITRVSESEVGAPYLGKVRTPAEWRETPGYVVFAKFKKDGYAFEVAWHFSGLANPVLDGIRGVFLP